MPIIRASNFADVSVDLTPDKLPMLVVGNEAGTGLSKVTLEEYLRNFNKYCGTCVTNDLNMYHERDLHVLTSAQACVLPTVNGRVEFAIDLYNYQSHSEPAVLVVMATAYGTSAQVVSGGNTICYFNDNGTSRLFRAERITEYRASQGRQLDGPMTGEEKALNGIYIFQVPLKVRVPERKEYFASFYGGGLDYSTYNDESAFFAGGIPECAMMMPREHRKGMERAILSLGEEKGPYRGIKRADNTTHELVRDVDRPIRLTVQFYLCTDTDTISQENVNDICGQIRHIYDNGMNEGSLVVDAVAKPGCVSNQELRPTATATKSGPAGASYLVPEVYIL